MNLTQIDPVLETALIILFGSITILALSLYIAQKARAALYNKRQRKEELERFRRAYAHHHTKPM